MAMPDLGALLDGLQDGDLDMDKLAEWQKQIEEAAKNCDTDKLSSLADACGKSVESTLNGCTGECRAMLAFMDNAAGCGQLYANMGMQNIEGLCNGEQIEFTPGVIPTDVPATTTTDVPATTTTDVPATTTTDVPATTTTDVPAVATPTATVSGAGASSVAMMTAAALVILA